MKKTMSFRLAAGIFAPFAAAGFLASCEKAPEDQTGGEDRQIPSVTVTAGQAGETSLTFNLSPVNSAEVKYLVLSASGLAPDASAIMSDGKEADPEESKDYTETGLVPDTDYVVFAAARNSEGLTSLVAKAEMTTAAHVPVYPEITLSDVTTDGTTASFTYTLKSAESAYYLYLPSSEAAPSSEKLSADGTSLSTETSEAVVIEGLSWSTSYVLYAVAKNSDGYSPVASKTFETDAAPVDPPAVGDFYYSDGTWSSGNESPVSGKTVIGVVFKTGAAESDRSDYSLAGLDEVRGFVVSLENASYLVEEWWGTQSKTDFEWTVKTSMDAGTSQSEDDFSGYYNTLAITETAESLYGALAYDNFRAAYVAVSYGASDSEDVPAGTTGWFFPSAGQMKEIYNADVSASIEKAGGSDVTGDYWSSSTVAGSSPVYAYCVHIQSDSVTVEGLNQITRVWKVRPVLAF